MIYIFLCYVGDNNFKKTRQTLCWRGLITSPVCIDYEMLADAEQLMRERHIKWLIVTDAANLVCGLLDWHE